jgi:hypothetical protein
MAVSRAMAAPIRKARGSPPGLWGSSLGSGRAAAEGLASLEDRVDAGADSEGLKLEMVEVMGTVEARSRRLKR